jgi:exonuclease SbcC
MFREGPTRGKLSSLSTSRSAYVEATVVTNGQRYTIRQEVDSVSGKGDALVARNDVPVINDTKVRSFDAWAGSHLPTPEVFFASQFGAQGAGGLLTMDKGPRKAVVLRALGIEHLEGLAEQCRENKRNAEAKRNAMLATVADIEQRIDPEDLRDDLDRVTIMIEVETKELATAEAALETARAESQLNALARQAYETATAERNKLKGNLRQAEIELVELEERLGNNQALLGDAVAIREAAACAESLQAELGQARAVCTEVQAALGRATATETGAKRDALAAQKRATEAEARVAATESRLGGSAQVEDAERRLPALREALRESKANLDGLEIAITNARAAHVAGSVERIEVLRTGLDAITILPSARPLPSLAEVSALAQRALDVDDQSIEAAKLAPLEVARLEREILSAKRKLEAAQNDVRSWERIADQRAALDQAAATLEQDRATALVARRELVAAETAASKADTVTRAADHVVARASEVAEHVARNLAAVQPVAKRLERLAQAEARVAELQCSRAERLARIEALGKELRDSPDPSPPCEAPALASFIASVDRFRVSLGDHKAEAMRIHSELAQAEHRAIRLKAALAELATVENDLSDWTRLAHDLGRDGLQAVEIDAAGPVITELSNDLLHQAFGNRFTISFETTRPSSDGKREIEDFRISVLDTLNGREADAKTFSGGEKVILSEAIALALTMLACQRSGIERPTIIRDESGAALDGENGQRYVAMLRRAAKIVGADKVLFISHDPATWDLADARIVVADGRISVD